MFPLTTVMVESLGDWAMEAAALEDTGGGAGTYGGGDGDLSAVVDDVGFGGKLGVEVLVAAVDIGDESMPLLDAEDSLNVLLIPMLPKLESLMTGATLLIGLANS